MKMTRKLLALTGLAGTLVLGASSGFAADAVVLKAADVHPFGYPTVEAVVSLGKKLAAATNGKYEVKMFPQMQLGSEEATLQQTQIGALAMTRVSVGPVGPIVDDVNVFNLPFVFRDEEHMRKVIDGEIGAELLQKITDNPNANLIGMCWMDSGTRSVFNKVRPITKPEDLKGLKIRMMGNPLYVDTMNALGGTGIPMPMPEVYNGIATNVVQGAENNQPSYVSFNLISVAKYYSFTQHLMIPEILVFSKKMLQLDARRGSEDPHEAGPRSANGRARPVGQEGRRGDGKDEDHPGRGNQLHQGQDAVPEGREAGVGQVRRQVCQAHRAHQRREVGM